MISPFIGGAANFKSIGKQTTAFLEKLAKLYGAKVSEIEAKELMYAKVVGLACNPENITSAPCNMKFFFNSDEDDNLYSEVFININASSETLEFNEKDTGYRAPLLRSLLK